MTTPSQELASMDFENLIGGPLIAVVRAQAQSAMATVNFINQVGFKPDGEIATVTFNYTKMVPKEGEGETGDEEKKASLTVPFLAMLPIPYLRVQEFNIDFLAKINSVQSRQVDANFTNAVGVGARARWLWGGAQLKVTTTSQRQTREGSTVTRDYSMGIKVKAVQDEIPGGLDRLLSILESTIKEKIE